MKSLDEKLARIRSGAWTPVDFVIADAKDGEMGFGATAPGPVRGPDGTPGTALLPKAAYLEAMRAMTRSGLVDIMLTSASAAETLAGEGLFDGSPVTLAARLNDTTDIWNMRGAIYTSLPSRPFRSARVDRVRSVADLGLYSVTFSNDLDRDLASLEAYAAFRDEASAAGMRHFLEVFNPAFDVGLPADGLPAYVNDCIVRALAGVVAIDRPLFLKIPYNGAAAMEELAAFDPGNLIVGILGGARGTTRDTFELIAQAARHGARVALFGRKINFAESPLELVRLMRAVVEHQVTPIEAVRAYHDELMRHHLRPDRDIVSDLVVTDPNLTAEALP
ncbi:hypothetical protein EYW49_18040 [Siculibacillus lacustris]|uniref:Aldolase n=1 Tax=Siculibacillus lacustris TaxID=1549641 RepID=A0A4Q9VH98_9HYPH|nr:hypothetical protein [Siculibacillus lacustris]TBW34488.1 hypothetical protein EYW49_18040 [Siculibacillus lacustris]